MNNIAQNLVRRDYSERIHAHTYILAPAPAHTRYFNYTLLVYRRLNQIANRDLKGRKTAAPSRPKKRQVCCFGKRTVLRLDLKKSREGFCLGEVE